MSLRSFHIVFVTFCMLLSVFLTAWGFAISPEGASLARATGILGVIGLIVTPVYGVYFYRKARKLVL